MNNKPSKAKAAIIQDNYREDLVAAGFLELGKNSVSAKPPKIRWGLLYKGFKDSEKIEYLEKLASSMNYAAFIIQKERDDLLDLCIKQEKKIIAMDMAMEANQDMVQAEITKVNAERQKFNDASTQLKGDDIRGYLDSIEAREDGDNS